MVDQAMTPLRALTVAINAAFLDDGSLLARIGLDRVSIAALALDTAARALKLLPDGWVVTGEARIKRELEEVDEKLREIDGTTRLLLAFRIQQDGHAKTLGEAGRIADDRDRVRALYPDFPDES